MKKPEQVLKVCDTCKYRGRVRIYDRLFWRCQNPDAVAHYSSNMAWREKCPFWSGASTDCNKGKSRDRRTLIGKLLSWLLR